MNVIKFYSISLKYLLNKITKYNYLQLPPVVHLILFSKIYFIWKIFNLCQDTLLILAKSRLFIEFNSCYSLEGLASNLMLERNCKLKYGPSDIVFFNKNLSFDIMIILFIVFVYICISIQYMYLNISYQVSIITFNSQNYIDNTS